MINNTQCLTVPAPITVSNDHQGPDDLLTKEWLLTNKLGAYASSTVTGCNTRRYHALLAAATHPPVGRKLTLSALMDKLTIGDQTYDLAVNEFLGTIESSGLQYLVEFVNDVAPRYVYRVGDVELTKEIILAEATNAVAVRYTLRGGSAELTVSPFVAMRDFHHLRLFDRDSTIMTRACRDAVTVHDKSNPDLNLQMVSSCGQFYTDPQWWYHFHYRVEHMRGQDSREDLFTPGNFHCELSDGESCMITASIDGPETIDFDKTVAARRQRLSDLAASVESPESGTRRLAMASDAFVVRRSFGETSSSATILAGYHWFADWGRDTFIALPGLLLTTKRFKLARQVFRTFVAGISEGMVPNRFDDYGEGAHYNSIDASLWFVIAAERYVEATGDVGFWQKVLMPAAHEILTRYTSGTRFNIHAEDNGLISGGSHHTQLTWMDAALGDEVITPRDGKAVEVNALWHSAHAIMADRCRGLDGPLADNYAAKAHHIAESFNDTFCIPNLPHLYDCVGNTQDASLRPNQVLAVSLPHSPLSDEKQADIVRSVTEHLLTPMGLRTLSPFDPRYRKRYGGSWQSRDRAYHQGTVWAWLIGPFIEAHLKVFGNNPMMVELAHEWLSSFDDHLNTAGLGYIGEIFDGDRPHAPRGCIAQAWSVAEVLRARKLVTLYQTRLEK